MEEHSKNDSTTSSSASIIKTRNAQARWESLLHTNSREEKLISINDDDFISSRSLSRTTFFVACDKSCLGEIRSRHAAFRHDEYVCDRFWSFIYTIDVFVLPSCLLVSFFSLLFRYSVHFDKWPCFIRANILSLLLNHIRKSVIFFFLSDIFFYFSFTRHMHRAMDFFFFLFFFFFFFFLYVKDMYVKLD